MIARELANSYDHVHGKSDYLTELRLTLESMRVTWVKATRHRS